MYREESVCAEGKGGGGEVWDEWAEVAIEATYWSGLGGCGGGGGGGSSGGGWEGGITPPPSPHILTVQDVSIEYFCEGAAFEHEIVILQGNCGPDAAVDDV